MSLDAAFYAFSTVAEARAAWLEQLERIAEQHIEAGVIIDALMTSPPASEQVFDTDSVSLSRLWDLYHAIEAGTVTSVRWPSRSGDWHQLQDPAVDDFGQQAVACMIKYLSDCLANYRALALDIAAAATADAVLAIDLSAGWPDRACTGGLTLSGGGSFLALSDTPNTYTGQAGSVPVVNGTEDALEFVDFAFIELHDAPASYSGSADDFVVVNPGGTGLSFVPREFVSLLDVPSAYTGAARKAVVVNATEDGLEFLDIGRDNGSGTGDELRNRDFSLATRITYFDVAPTALLDFTEPFTSDSGQFQRYTETTQATFTVAGTAVIDNSSGAGRNDIVVRGSDLAMPLVGVTIDVSSRTGTLGAYSNAGVGIAQDANNFVFAVVDAVAATVTIQVKIGGSNSFNATVGHALTPPYTLGFSLVGNSACAYAKVSGVWTFITGYDIPAGTINFKTASLSGWKRGFVVATPNNQTWTFDNLLGGAFGGCAIRDIAVVTNADGSPLIYSSGGHDCLDVTATLPDGMGISGCGILRLDIDAYSITQIGCLMIDRGSAKQNDHASHIVVDSGTYRLWITSWGNGFGGDISIYYLDTSTDIRSGSHLLSGASKLTIPLQASGYAAYDPFAIKDGSTWRLAHAICENTTFSGSPFFPAVATSTDLSTWTDDGSDPSARPYEGTRFVKLGDELSITAGSSYTARIYDRHMNFRGTMNATLSGGSLTQPHPNVVDTGDKLLLITFNNVKAAGASASFTWGQLEIHEAG